ncbi:MAG: hypothetical protein ACKORI_05380 [Verrucomicrobiota bacterium]
MKHILPILTLTTLAAAASAQAASGLSYNNLSLVYTDVDDAAGSDGYAIAAQVTLGSNVLIQAASNIGGDTRSLAGDNDSLSIGYIFKNVAAGVDVTPYVGTEDTYGVLLRRTLSEVVAGLEVRAAYEQVESVANASNGALLVGVGYSFAKSYTVDVNYINAEGDLADSWQVGLRYNF